MGARPIGRPDQPRAAVQLAGVAPARVPAARRLGQVTVHAAPVGVLVEPRPQARPLAQQRLVRDLDLALADRDQAVAREHRQDVVDVARQVARSARARARRRRRRGAAGSAAPRRAGRVQPLVGALGQPSDRAEHAAGLLVGAHRRARGRRAAATARAARSTAAGARRRASRRRRAARRRARVRRAGRRAGRQLDRAPQLVRGASGRPAPGWRRAGARAPGSRRSGRRSRRARRRARACAVPGRARRRRARRRTRPARRRRGRR